MGSPLNLENLACPRCKWIYLVDSKNDERRKVKMTNEVRTLLTECTANKKPDDFVLTRADGSRVAQPRKDWYSLCSQATDVNGDPYGVLDDEGHYEGLQMHDLRRSAAKHMLKLGIPEKHIMQIAGWKTRSMFDRYLRTADKDLEQAAELMNRQAKPKFKNRHKNDTTNFAETPVSSKSLN